MHVAKAGRHISNTWPVQLFGEPMRWFDTDRYLGMTLESRLSWLAYVDQMRKKAAQTQGVLGPLLNRSGLRQKRSSAVDSSWNVMAHGDARDGKWRGNWRMELVASTLHTTSEHGVSSITTADAHTSAASSWMNWRPPADLNGLVRFAERRNLVSARVPSHFKWPLPVTF